MKKIILSSGRIILCRNICSISPINAIYSYYTFEIVCNSGSHSVSGTYAEINEIQDKIIKFLDDRKRTLNLKEHE